MRGILILSMGHPFYGQMAAALAATLKAAEPTLPIHLAYAGDALKYLKGEELSLFSSNREINGEFFLHDQKKWIRAKMFLDKLSPFDETIYLDADVLWLKRSPLEIFDQLKKVNLTFPNFSFNDFSINQQYGSNAWVNIDQVKKAYRFKTGKYYHLHSEMVYFKKSSATTKFFAFALDSFDNLKVKATTFAGTVPDELPFSIACIKTKQYPHESPYRPFYWRPTEKGFRQIYEIAKDFYGVSMAGNENSIFEIDTYNSISSAAYHKLGLQQPYKWKSKSGFLPERKDF